VNPITIGLPDDAAWAAEPAVEAPVACEDEELDEQAAAATDTAAALDH
jgi:hypothetical protein